MMSFVMKVRLVLFSEIARIVGRLREKRCYVLFSISVVVLAVVCALAVQASARAGQLTPEYFRQKIDQRFAASVEVYYLTWRAFVDPGPIRESALVTDSWICRSTLKFPIAAPLAEELAAMTWEPLKERPRDFRLSCIVTFNEDEKPVTISFAKYPLAVCINGQPFKPSWKLCLRVSDFLPYEARRGLLKSFREEWQSEGYPGIPKEEEGENEENGTGQ